MEVAYSIPVGSRGCVRVVIIRPIETLAKDDAPEIKPVTKIIWLMFRLLIKPLAPATRAVEPLQEW